MARVVGRFSVVCHLPNAPRALDPLGVEPVRAILSLHLGQLHPGAKPEAKKGDFGGLRRVLRYRNVLS